MFEKVNPQHPDKVADRIAGAIVDLCYTKSEWPKVAAEVLLEALQRGAASMRKQANYKMKRADKTGPNTARSEAIVNLLAKAQMVDDCIKHLNRHLNLKIPA